jgi:DNA repair protein RecN (Recombination protein N)
MASAQLSVEFEQLEEPKDSGFDKVTFLFNANKGAELQPLNKVASGGELSRLMLSLKAMLSKSASLPTIIFDEIDTGISGDIAAKAGNIMKEMGKDMQVITITHLPQVAGKGHSHLHVYKAERAGKTVSKIRTLNEAERVEEIAKMLSAGKPGEAAMENARELMVVE